MPYNNFTLGLDFQTNHNFPPPPTLHPGRETLTYSSGGTIVFIVKNYNFFLLFILVHILRIIEKED